MSAAPDDHCITQRIYYRIRAAFQRTIPALATRIGPETRLKEFLHRKQWQRVWEAMKIAAGVREWPATVPWRCGIRSRSIGDLVWHVAFSVVPVGSSLRPWTRGEVAIALRRIIVEESGVPVGFDFGRTFRQLGID